MNSDITLDARSLLCPLPVLKARKALQTMEIGAVLALMADDPAAQIDVPHFCAEAKHTFLGTETSSDGPIYYIKKG